MYRYFRSEEFSEIVEIKGEIFNLENGILQIKDNDLIKGFNTTGCTIIKEKKDLDLGLVENWINDWYEGTVITKEEFDSNYAILLEHDAEQIQEIIEESEDEDREFTKSEVSLFKDIIKNNKLKYVENIIEYEIFNSNNTITYILDGDLNDGYMEITDQIGELETINYNYTKVSTEKIYRDVINNEYYYEFSSLYQRDKTNYLTILYNITNDMAMELMELWK